MAHTRNTFPERFQATQHARRDKLGKPVLPRVVEHPPLAGDVHPLDKKTLLRLLPVIPLRFLHGIRTIELRARPWATDDHPMATYEPRDRLIRLYSQPYPDSPLRGALQVIDPESILGLCGASVIERDGERLLHWQSRLGQARYFFTRILAHELGHHHVYQFKHKRRPPGTLRGHEERANAIALEINAWARFNLVFPDSD